MRSVTIMMIIALGGIVAGAEAQNISYSGKNISLQDFFSVITTQTGYTVFYNNEVISRSHPITLNLQNTPIQTALNQALSDQPLSYKVQGNTIFISVKQMEREVSENTTVVHGNIRDSANRPIANASVTIMNRSKSVMTEEDGDFTIQAGKGDSLLLITCVGYENKEIKIKPEFLHIELTINVNPLEQVIVGGNMMAIKRKAEATSLTIIDGKTLDALPVNNISQIYRGFVPGTNSFSMGDATEEVSTMSIRGTGGQFPFSQIAVYVDGIEYAGGSGYLSMLNKENIDRVEVLRGPASSTLYGTGSNGGIIQVYTKKTAPGQSSLNFTASAGFISSKWVSSNAYQQFYNIESVTGLKKIAFTVGGTYMSNGAFLPDGGGRTGAMYAGIKWNPSDKLSANFYVRYENSRRHQSRYPGYDTATHPNQAAIANHFGPTESVHKDIDDESYLVGINLTHRTTAHWTNNLTAGYSQNGYNGIPTADSVISQASRYYFISANKNTTIRYFNDLQWGGNDGFSLHLMSGLEYKKYFYRETFVTPTGSIDFSGDPANENYGIFAQANPSYKNIYLTLALRYDHNRYFKNDGSYNPRIGLTTNFNIENKLIVKPRIAWGSGISAPLYTYRYGGGILGNVVPNPNIKPQDQQGFDYGLELFSPSNRFSFEVIYYDNRLKNMFVPIDLPDSFNQYLNYSQYVNVGEIANKGWEFSASFKPNSNYSVRATFSAMSSFIQDSTGLSHSQGPASRTPGSQIIHLPRHTAGLFMTWNFPRLAFLKGRGDISLNVTEVDGVLAVDLASLAIDGGYGRYSYSDPHYVDPYWKKTGMIIQLGLNADYYITNDFRFFIQGSNIANNNNYEFSSQFPTYGASWMFGIKYNIVH